MMAGWPRVTCQRDKGRLCDDFGPKMDCKQSRAMMIGTKINRKAAKQQFCDES